MGMNMKKWALLVGALVAGLVILATVLDSSGSEAIVTEPTQIIPTQAAPPTNTKPPKDQPVDATGAAIGLYNGTAEAGLADKEAKKMDAYNVVQVGNTLDQQDVTTVYFVKAKDQQAADEFAAAEYPDANVQPLEKGTQVSVDGTTEKVTNELQIVVFLGADQL